MFELGVWDLGFGSLGVGGFVPDRVGVWEFWSSGFGIWELGHVLKCPEAVTQITQRTLLTK